jgi:hypothetical protein
MTRRLPVSPGLWQRIRQSRYRWVLRLAVVAVAGLAMLLWSLTRQSDNTLAVENRSNQRIAILQVTLAAKPTAFRDIAPGATARVRLVAGDSVAVDGKLADGTLIRWHGTPPEGATLVVLPGGQIEVRTSRKAARLS